MSLLAAFGVQQQQIVIASIAQLGENLVGATLTDGRKVYVGKKTADEPSNWNGKTAQPHMEVRNIKGALWLIDSRKASELPKF